MSDPRDAYDQYNALVACRLDLAELRTKLADRERRIRLVRRQLSVALGPYGHFEDDEDLLRALDLRKPLPKGRRR